MKTITQETIVGQVQSIGNDDYLINFVVKTIREGGSANINVSSSPWKNWNFTTIKEGDQVQLTGQLTSSTWSDPFEGSEWETLHLEATNVSILAA